MRPGFPAAWQGACKRAVSYTHLDVYKRQGLRQCAVPCQKRLPYAGAGNQRARKCDILHHVNFGSIRCAQLLQLCNIPAPKPAKAIILAAEQRPCACILTEHLHKCLRRLARICIRKPLQDGAGKPHLPAKAHLLLRGGQDLSLIHI